MTNDDAPTWDELQEMFEGEDLMQELEKQRGKNVVHKDELRELVAEWRVEQNPTVDSCADELEAVIEE